MIEIQQLTKDFGNLRAVDNLNLSLPQGEFFAFLGPNGAGKTTTIKMLAGLLRPTTGHAIIGGHNIQTEPEAAKAKISYVPDFPFLYEKLTPAEFLRFTGELFEMDRGTIKRESAVLFEKLHLDEHAHRQIEGLSHGTRQRVVLASALLHRPEVLIIDEPMVGLDPTHARIVKDELKARSRNGVTIFLSTHTLSVAEEIADRVGIISRGRLIALGTVEELRTLSARSGALEHVFLRLIEESTADPSATPPV